jgi:hypothetical protein
MMGGDPPAIPFFPAPGGEITPWIYWTPLNISCEGHPIYWMPLTSTSVRGI